MANKVALITGAAGGIGTAIAEKLKSEGFDLALNVRTVKPQFKELVERLSDENCHVQVVLGDIARAEDCTRNRGRLMCLLIMQVSPRISSSCR